MAIVKKNNLLDPNAIVLQPNAVPAPAQPLPAPEILPPQPDLNQALFQPTQAPAQQPTLANASVPQRPVGTMDDMGGWRKAGLLASVFAGEAAKPGSMQPILGQMRQQQESQRQYDQNLPIIQQQANDARDQRALTQLSTRSQIDQRNRQFTQEQNNRKATLLSQLQGELQAGKVPPDQLRYKYGRLASVQGINLAPEEIDNELQQIKPAGAAFTVVKGEKGRPEGLQDRAGNVFTPDKIPNDPNAQSMWKAAVDAHQQGLTEEEDKENRQYDRQNKLLDKRMSAMGLGGGPDDALVDQIGTGKMPLTRMDYLLTRNPVLASAVAAKYPDFDGSKIKAYVDTTHNFTSGPASVQLNAGATGLKHMNELLALNTNASHIPGTADYNRYMNKADTLATELAKFYGDATVPAINAIKSTLTATLPGQREAAIKEQAKSMGDKFDSYEQTWKNAAPSSAYQAPMPGIDKAAMAARAKLDPAYAARIANNSPSSGGVVNIVGGNQGGNVVSQHVIRVGNKNYRYNGTGDTADMKNYTEAK